MSEQDDINVDVEQEVFETVEVDVAESGSNPAGQNAPYVVYGTAKIGPKGNRHGTVDKLVKLTGFKFPNSKPKTIVLQARQSANIRGPDQFAMQVVWTTSSSILVRVRRLDGPLGWSQNLLVNVVVADWP